jgi:ubiquitin carboxyl-terminal hydrolase 8
MYDDAEDAWAKIQQFSQSPISAVVRGQYAQKTQCTQCFALSYTFDSYSQLTVELPEGAQTTIEDALNLHFSHELLAASSSAAYKCTRCANKVYDADKHLTLWRLPHVLIIHLKRFASNSYRLVKNKTAVEYGCELDVEPFMNYASPETETKYALMAVVVCTMGGRARAYARCCSVTRAR